MSTHDHGQGRSRALWCVVVVDPRFHLADEPDKVIGPFTSEDRAAAWARRINEGTELGAEVHGMYSQTDPGLKDDLLRWSSQVEESS